ncbi:MAG: hypothetical protein IT366_09920 [Candidatus Hydrogenedentes bacterium]|nr:hypothetical protein [Candidatus Hydrogenedentota bacterium]
MKKTDVSIALTLGLLISAVAVWFTQPSWYKNLAKEIREWREPRRPAMNRYIERDRMRRQEEAENERRKDSPDRQTDSTKMEANYAGPKMTFTVIDATTKEPVKSFRYRRYFEARRPGDPPREIPWNSVSSESGTFEIAAERTFVPVKRPNDDTLVQTEIWKMAIENEMQKRRAQSDTLEVSAEGYQQESLLLFEFMNSQQAATGQPREIRLLRLDASAASTEKEARIREESEKVNVQNEYNQLVSASRKAARLVVPENARARVQGTVTVNGEPPSEGMIFFSSPMVPEILEVHIAPDGSYNAEALMAGSNVLTLRATMDGVEWQEHRETITLSKDAPNAYSYDFESTGTLLGTITGLQEGEVGGIFAIKGDYELNNVTEDDLYDFGEICEGEARPNKEGIFKIRELEEGKYTIIAIAERHVAGEDSSFLYVTDTVEIRAGEEANVSLSLN